MDNTNLTDNIKELEQEKEEILDASAPGDEPEVPEETAFAEESGPEDMESVSAEEIPAGESADGTPSSGESADDLPSREEGKRENQEQADMKAPGAEEASPEISPKEEKAAAGAAPAAAASTEKTQNKILASTSSAAAFLKNRTGGNADAGRTAIKKAGAAARVVGANKAKQALQKGQDLGKGFMGFLNSVDNLEHNDQVQVIMGIYSVSALLFFLIFGLFMDGLGTGFLGFINLQRLPSQMTLDYFKYGSVSGTFLNVGLVGLGCMLVFRLSKAKLGGVSLLAYFLTIGFAFFGMNIVNMWPCILGTFLYALVHRVPFASQVNISIFSTALAPFVSEMFWRYPPIQGNPLLRLLIGILTGVFAGFFMPYVCQRGPAMHHGHTLYNAAVGAGFIAILLYSFFFKALGVEGPVNTDLGDSIPVAVNAYALATSIIGLALAYVMNGRTFKNVKDIFRKSGYDCDITLKDPALALFNISIFNLFMTFYYNIIGASMTAPTLAAIICSLAAAGIGAHVLNMLPIILGYAVACTFCSFPLNGQAIILGLNFAAAITPIAGGFGPLVGIAAGMLHAILVTQIVTFYNAFCFYNGGFTSFFVALFLGVVLDQYFVRDMNYHWNPIPLRKKKEEAE